MPIGIILIDWDSAHGPILKAQYMEEKIEFDIEYLNIFLLHTATGWTEDKAQKQAFTQYSKYNLVSRYFPLIQDNALRRIVIAVVLKPNEVKPNKYYETLEEIASNKILTSEDASEMTTYLKELYESKLKGLSYEFTLDEVKNMIPLKTSIFREDVNQEVIEAMKNKFGDWALDFLDHLPQNLEVMKLENLFQRQQNEVIDLIIWATKKGLLRLIG